MTNQEAINIIEDVSVNTNCDNCFYKYDNTCDGCRVETALNIAIEALENQKTLKEELEKIIDKIDFEEKWLINIKTENGFISIADIRIAMCRIGQVVSSELKGE